MEKQQIEAGAQQVICQKWTETERGWGQRPDGFSLHLSYEGLKKYIQDYWNGMPDEIPDEYSYPDGTPYPAGVSEAVIAEIEQAGDGVRFYTNYAYPGSGGIDGWMPVRNSPPEA